MISQVIHTSGHSLPQNLLTLFTAIFFDVLICELPPPKLSSVLTEELFCTLFDPVWASFQLLHDFRDAEQWLLRVLEPGRGWGVWVSVGFVKWRGWTWVFFNPNNMSWDSSLCHHSSLFWNQNHTLGWISGQDEQVFYNGTSGLLAKRYFHEKHKVFPMPYYSTVNTIIHQSLYRFCSWYTINRNWNLQVVFQK